MPVRLTWERLAPVSGDALVVRHGKFRAASLLHTHDFAELFIVESGSADHEVDNIASKVTTGSLALVSPEDTHRFLVPTADFVLTNVAFPTEIFEYLRRVAPQVNEVWTAENSPISLVPALQTRLLRQARQLASHTSSLGVIRFVADVLLSLERPASLEPSWLGRAVRDWQRDAHAIHDGVAGIARLAGRSREHVSRVIKTSTGRRAIDVVNEARMELAATLLLTTDDSILRVAQRVGISSTSHFYSLFRDEFGTTPRRFRELHRSVVDPAVGPSGSHD